MGVFTGLLFGAMMPYAFAAMTMKSVGMAANSMVKECNEQFDKMFALEEPRRQFKSKVQGALHWLSTLKSSLSSCPRILRFKF